MTPKEGALKNLRFYSREAANGQQKLLEQPPLMPYLAGINNDQALRAHPESFCIVPLINRTL